VSTHKNIVITGSTRGIGYGLTEAFLQRGCRVVISGRDPLRVEQALQALAHNHGERVLGQACDMTVFEQVQALWDVSRARMGSIDIWINNAGRSNLLMPFWELDPAVIKSVVDTNVTGSMYGARVALAGLRAQGHGSFYNMEGFGSRGRRQQPGLSLYGASKASVGFLTDAMIAETRGSPVLVGSILPGMVVTDMLLNQRSGDPLEWERSKRIFNILADRVETAAPWIVERILSNEVKRKHGLRISRLSGLKVLWRFLSAPFTKRQVID
jgi:NAD(P)-dependent dehydrogenase (short-subunit alcohol dehydrogenase family)